ncbi:CLUMA_CG008877, isoform A [Clunio marinus]|uniref:CLUMA_CG008877, isoform A n=1 Tax=Clunio marinus TaxID=568069 RepID=A0A1J1I4Z2_9DIPT|nr:CLUMA_CG008877, isoform A [Clunio marinus]
MVVIIEAQNDVSLNVLLLLFHVRTTGRDCKSKQDENRNFNLTKHPQKKTLHVIGQHLTDEFSFFCLSCGYANLMLI